MTAPDLRSGGRWLHEILAFLLEIAALVALGYWGYVTGTALWAKLTLAVAAPVLAAVVWGLFAAPRARFTVPLAGVLATKALVFGAATAALYATGHPVLATAYAAITLVNTVIVTRARQREPLVSPER